MRTLAAVFVLTAVPATTSSTAVAADGPITIRTEGYPRPPYSGATYYIYEQCETTYRRGGFKDPLDVQTGAPYDTTPAQVLSPGQRSRHVCLTRFGLR